MPVTHSETQVFFQGFSGDDATWIVGFECQGVVGLGPLKLNLIHTWKVRGIP
jgi:hypothetical protein